MALICEDLSSYGVVLIPPDSQQYFDLLADIERRLQNRPQGSPLVCGGDVSRIGEHNTSGSAILVNRAKVAIATLAYVWSRHLPNGHIATGSRTPGTNPSVLLPFLQRPQNRKFDAYWNTIFPGSKRLITIEGNIYGDNTDVRPPASDELSTGGGGGVGTGGGSNNGEPFKLTLDGVFFVDGRFAGPNWLGSWDHLVAAREAYLSASALARNAPATFFAQMDSLSGLDTDPWRGLRSAFAPLPPRPLPPSRNGPDREAIREYQRQCIARTALRMRNTQGDAAAIKAIAAWLDTPGPEPHRLP